MHKIYTSNPLNVMEGSTMYDTASKMLIAPLKVRLIVAAFQTLSCGLYEVRTWWFALIHSDAFDISRLLILFERCWCIVNKRITLSENTSLSMKSELCVFDLFLHREGTQTACCVLSDLMLAQKISSRFDLPCCFLAFFPLSGGTLRPIQERKKKKTISQ